MTTNPRQYLSHEVRPTLLLADDEPAVRATLTHQLSTRFQIVAAAGDADEAIALAHAHRPDLAIIDVEMPGGGGLRATREIRVCSPNTAMLVLSSDESEDGVRALLGAGAITYLRKGLPADELARSLYATMHAHAKLDQRP